MHRDEVVGCVPLKKRKLAKSLKYILLPHRVLLHLIALAIDRRNAVQCHDEESRLKPLGIERWGQPYAPFENVQNVRHQIEFLAEAQKRLLAVVNFVLPGGNVTFFGVKEVGERRRFRNFVARAAKYDSELLESFTNRCKAERNFALELVGLEVVHERLFDAGFLTDLFGGKFVVVEEVQPVDGLIRLVQRATREGERFGIERSLFGAFEGENLKVKT